MLRIVSSTTENAPINEQGLNKDHILCLSYKNKNMINMYYHTLKEYLYFIDSGKINTTISDDQIFFLRHEVAELKLALIMLDKE